MSINQPMHSVFENKTKNSLEKSWFFAFGGGVSGLGNGSADDWEAVVGRTPIDQWRPDSKFSVEDNYGRVTMDTECTLAEAWLKKHNSSWTGFIKRVQEAFPVLDKLVVVKAAISGMGKENSNRGRFEARGSELVVLGWLKAYESLWSGDVELRNSILRYAIDVDFLDVAALAIKCGANSQMALYLVKSRASFDLLKDNGADPFLKLNEEVPNFSVERGYKYKDIFDKSLKNEATVHEYLMARDELSFVATKDRESILNFLSRSKLKVSKGGIASDDERKNILFGVIVNARKKQDIIVALKACIPDAWAWKFSNGSTLLMMLSDSSHFNDVCREFGEKIPDVALAQRGRDDISLLEYILKRRRGSWLGDASLFDRMKSLTPMDAQRVWGLIEDRAKKKIENMNAHFFECPLFNKQKRRLSLNISPSEFWELAKENAKVCGDDSVLSVLMKSVSESSKPLEFSSSWENSIREWFDGDQNDNSKEKLSWGVLGCAISLKSILMGNKYFDERSLMFKNFEAEISYWVAAGVDVLMALDMLKNDGYQEQHMRNFKNTATVGVERYALKRSIGVEVKGNNNANSVL